MAVVGGTTTNGTEPTWVVTKGAKTTDNTVTWQECTGQPGVNGDTTNCPTWLQNKNTAVTLGMIITDAVVDTLFICTTAGTTGNGSEPAWNKTAGSTTTDNTATWTSIGAVGNFSAWAAPHARLANTVVANWAAAGQTVYVGDNHAETQAAALALTAGTAALPISFYCVSHTTAPPTSVTTGASVTTTGNNAITIGGASGSGLYLNGIKFSCGTGANATAFNFSTTQTFAANVLIFENCTLVRAATTAANYVFGTGLECTKVRLINTTMQFGATGDHIAIAVSDFQWRDTASAIQGATLPTTLFNWASNSTTAIMQIDGVDLSAITGTIMANTSQGGRAYFNDCALNASATPSSAPSMASAEAVFVRCSSTAGDYDIKQYSYEGTMLSSTVVTRNGGASDGTTSIGYNCASTANASFINAFEVIPIVIWNSATGSTRTVTLYGVTNTASMPTNMQVWFDVEYLGSSSNPLGSYGSSAPASGIASASALTADTSNWGANLTARLNTTSYSVGNIIGVSSNTNRVFFCTTAGTSSGSLPAGYASAVDGGSVTDGGAVFRAGYRFSISVALSSPTPQLAGYMRIMPRVGVASTTVYFDPLPVLS